MKTHWLLFIVMRKFSPLPVGVSDKIAGRFRCHNFKGACHGDDLHYLFRAFWSPNITPSSVEDISIRRMVKLWTNFAKYGNPTPSTDEYVNVTWKQIDESLTYLDIDKELKLKSHPQKERMQFWFNLLKE